MNTKRTLIFAALGLAVCLQPTHAQNIVWSDGSDGALAPDGTITNIVIDLSEAKTGVWDENNEAHAGKGIYDPAKWAVVFKYSNVSIPRGVTVSFKNHPSHAPVVWLVADSATILGTVDVSGHPGQSGPLGLTPTEPGPGGFRGGPSGPAGCGVGLGPGGGDQASHATFKDLCFPCSDIWTGNQLIGGSGGSGSEGNAGGGGGGAIMIGAAYSLINEGAIYAKGGGSGWAGGSGGTVKIVAQEVLGSGEINCLADGTSAGAGRAHIFTKVLAPEMRIYPETTAASYYYDPIVWPADSTPSVSIVQVGADCSRDEPTAPLAGTADFTVEDEHPVAIKMETTNFPLEGTVLVRAAYKWGAASWVRASYLDGNEAKAHWRASYRFPKGYTTLQARATAP